MVLSLKQQKTNLGVKKKRKQKDKTERRDGLNDKEIHPKKGDRFFFEAEVLSVKFKAGKRPAIIVRLEEVNTKSKFVLEYTQTQIPGL
tara:strand:+ start:111 stop:374 length:264 start_codon:yes stop_codon:yes gene_type:complete